MRTIRHSLRVVGLAILALAAGGGVGRGDVAGPVPVLVGRAAAVESTAPVRRASRLAPRHRPAGSRLAARSAPPIDRAPRRSPVVRRAMPPPRSKSPTYVVHRALLR